MMTYILITVFFIGLVAYLLREKKDDEHIYYRNIFGEDDSPVTSSRYQFLKGNIFHRKTNHREDP